MGDDITPFIQAKSDQLNADDLIGGPITARIVNVKVTGGDQQPVTVELDDGKPWKPCKTTMRVLAALWGPRAGEWVGRTVRLYRDPTVRYGGVEVGGIRISGMSHIDKPKVLTLSSSKKTKTEYRIEVLRDTPQARPMPAAQTRQANTAELPTVDETKALRDELATIMEDIGEPPSALRSYLMNTTGRDVPPVASWDAERLRWAVKQLKNGMRAKFRAWLDAMPPEPAALSQDPRQESMNLGDDDLPV